MARAAQQTQPEGPPNLDLDCHAGGLLASQTAHPPSLAQPALRRHPPEVGAVCGKAARTDLCGGRGGISVPTATEAKSGAAVPHFASLNAGYSAQDDDGYAPRKRSPEWDIPAIHNALTRYAQCAAVTIA